MSDFIEGNQLANVKRNPPTKKKSGPPPPPKEGRKLVMDTALSRAIKQCQATLNDFEKAGLYVNANAMKGAIFSLECFLDVEQQQLYNAFLCGVESCQNQDEEHDYNETFNTTDK